ncbi:DinB family protein [Tenacibaculum sp.]|uniref:DinB family protein n=1 Tax=Tenacibaculum sp. TaxID=1906242 RepID=UPI003AA87D78
MNAIGNILLNFSETRRRSLKLWKDIPDEFLNWKPDSEAFSIIEMIRHILEGEHLFHTIIKNSGDLGNYKSLWENLAFSDLKNELSFAERYRNSFIEMIKTLNETDLENIRIERKEVGQSKTLGDYLNRMVYHEAVHTGQLLGYLRTLGVKRPKIWD